MPFDDDAKGVAASNGGQDRAPATVSFGEGTVVYSDPFQWLESDDDDVLDWQHQQDERARTILRGLPRYLGFLRRLEEMGGSDDMALPLYAGGHYVHRHVPNGGNLEAVSLSDTPDGPRRCVFDLNRIDSDQPLQLGAYALSNDGTKAIAAYAAGGTEKPVVRIVDVVSGAVLSEGLPSERLNTFTWLPDDTGFFYLSMDAADLRQGRTLYRVDMSAPSTAIREDVDTSHFYARPVVCADRRHVLLFVNHLAPCPEFILDTHSQRGWRPFLKGVNGIYRGDIIGDRFVAITDDGAPTGRLVAIPLATPMRRETWQEILPASADVLANVMVVGDRIVLLDLVDTYSRLRVFDAAGNPEGEIPLPGKGLVNRTGSFFSFFNVTNTVVRGPGDEFEFLFSTPATSPAHYTADARTREMRQRTIAELVLPAQVVDRTAVSADGAQVPYHVVARDNLDLAAPRPTVIIGYGGYNVAVLPGWFGTRWAAWIEAGGVLVLAHLRGGGELGSDWWEQGRLARKQNTFNDLYAVAADLIASGVTSSAQLGVTGGSNGGVMAAVAAVQRPDLFAAVSPEAPVCDVLGRVRDPLTMAATLDYGDPHDPDMAKVLMDWSPYQNVRDGRAYPAMLIDCGANDPRCPPWHGRKLAARMQDATAGMSPILLRVREGAGHGTIGHADQTRQSAEVLAFFAEYLGLAEPRDAGSILARPANLTNLEITDVSTR